MGLAQSDFAQSVHLKTQSGLEQPYSLVLLALAAVLRLSVTVTMRVVPSVCWWWHRWLPFCIRLLAFPLFSSGFSLLREKKNWVASLDTVRLVIRSFLPLYHVSRLLLCPQLSYLARPSSSPTFLLRYDLA